MEKSKFGDEPLPNGHDIGQPPPFSIKDPATGKYRTIREMTDPEIAKYVASAQGELDQHRQLAARNIMDFINAQMQGAITITNFLTLLHYETDRRKSALKIVSKLDG